MKRIALFAACLLFLSGCGSENPELDRGIRLRTKLLQGNGTSFETKIIADYGDKTHSFHIACESTKDGDIHFQVMSPDSISGISGEIGNTGGALTFDETALHFPLLADGQLSPISAPWILLRALRSGYLTYVCEEDGFLRLTVDDSYEENALKLDIWLNELDLPSRADVLYDGKRILSLTVEKFEIL